MLAERIKRMNASRMVEDEVGRDCETALVDQRRDDKRVARDKPKK